MDKLFGLLLCFTFSAHAQRAQVIYGSDDRKDFYEFDVKTAELAQSTAVQVYPVELKVKGNVTELVTAQYGTSLALCSTERFYEQRTVGHCTGFLVGEDILLTAGHCISNENSCKNARFVFGFAMHSTATPSPWEVPSNDIYACAKVIHSEAESNGADFAVVQLDRKVEGRAPLAYRKSGQPSVGDGLSVIGYPEGLPVKAAGNAWVRKVTPWFLQTNLDTYGGNSGSPVFNNHGEVEGILVRGDNDFVLKNGCYISNQCPDGGCRGEDVTLMSKVLPYLTQ